MVEIGSHSEHFREVAVGVSFGEVVEDDGVLVGDVLGLEVREEGAEFVLDLDPLVDAASGDAHSERLMTFWSGRSHSRKARLAATSVREEGGRGLR